MSIMIYSPSHSLRFHNRTARADGSLVIKPMDMQQAYSEANRVFKAEDAYFTIHPKETKIAPDWIKTDWNFAAHIRAGTLVEIRPMVHEEINSLSSQIPTGDAPPPEAIQYNKLPPPPSAAFTASNPAQQTFTPPPPAPPQHKGGKGARQDNG